MAAGFDINNAPPTQQLSFANDPAFIQLYNGIVGNTGPGGQFWSAANTTNTLNQYATDFTQQFQNSVGRAPTSQEMSQFLSQAVAPVMSTQAGFSGTDPNQVVSQYVPQAFQSQIQQNQQAQLPGQITSLLSALRPAVDQGIQSFAQGPGMQQLEGQMNNLGLLDSGAFNSALASQVSGIGGNLAAGAVADFALPQFAGSQSPTLQQLMGFGRDAGSNIAGNNQNLFDFNLQAGLGQQLFNQSQPSGTQTAIGDLSSIFQGFGSAGQGASGFKNATSYVCMELIRRGLATQRDLDELHYKVMPAVFLKGRAFWNYARNGKALVDAANKANIDWLFWKKWLLDEVLAAKNSIEAVERYSAALWAISQVAEVPHLFDDRSFGKSFWDSLLFLPRLILYKPFVKAFLKAVRMRMLFIYDMPESKLRV